MKYSFAETIKAVAGFVVGVGSAMVTRLTTEGGVLPGIDPFDWKGWVIFLVIAILGYLGVYIPPNALSQAQIAQAQALPPADFPKGFAPRHAKPE